MRIDDVLKPYLSGVLKRYRLTLVRGFRLVIVETEYPFFRLTDDLIAEVCLPRSLPKEDWRSVILHEFAHVLLLETERDLLFERLVLVPEEAPKILSRASTPLEPIMVFRVLQDLVLLLFISKLADPELVEAHVELLRSGVESALTAVAHLKAGALDETCRQERAKHLALMLLLAWIMSQLYPDREITVATKRLPLSLEREENVVRVLSGALSILDSDGVLCEKSAKVAHGVISVLSRTNLSSWSEVYRSLAQEVFNEALELRRHGYELRFETTSVRLAGAGKIRFTFAKVIRLGEVV